MTAVMYNRQNYAIKHLLGWNFYWKIYVQFIYPYKRVSARVHHINYTIRDMAVLLHVL